MQEGPSQFHATAYFPTTYLSVRPPVPTKWEHGLPMECEYGTLRFYFDEYEVGWNDPAQGNEWFDHVQLMIEMSSDQANAEVFGREPDDWEGLTDWVKSPRHTEAYNRATAARYSGPEQEAWQALRRELHDTAREAAEAWVSDEVNSQRRQVGQVLNTTIGRMLEVLRTRYGQATIPDPPRWNWRHVWIRFASGESVSLSRELESRWLDPQGSTSAYHRPFDLQDWADVAALVEESWRPSFVEVLLANARQQCDPLLGSGRLALVEAVTALEIVVKVAMGHVLEPHGVSKSALDRIVRGTPTADLVNVWLRPHVPSEKHGHLATCAQAVHERNELIHHERRTVKQERAAEMVDAVSSVVALLRESLGSKAMGPHAAI